MWQGRGGAPSGSSREISPRDGARTLKQNSSKMSLKQNRRPTQRRSSVILNKRNKLKKQQDRSLLQRKTTHRNIHNSMNDPIRTLTARTNAQLILDERRQAENQ